MKVIQGMEMTHNVDLRLFHTTQGFLRFGDDPLGQEGLTLFHNGFHSASHFLHDYLVVPIGLKNLGCFQHFFIEKLYV